MDTQMKLILRNINTDMRNIKKIKEENDQKKVDVLTKNIKHLNNIGNNIKSIKKKIWRITY